MELPGYICHTPVNLTVRNVCYIVGIGIPISNLTRLKSHASHWRMNIMEKDTREVLERLESKVDNIAIEVAELTAWKNRIMGVFIGISMCGALVVDKIKDFFS